MDNEPESSIYAAACIAFVLVSIFAALVVISVIARLWF